MKSLYTTVSQVFSASKGDGTCLLSFPRGTIKPKVFCASFSNPLLRQDHCLPWNIRLVSVSPKKEPHLTKSYIFG